MTYSSVLNRAPAGRAAGAQGHRREGHRQARLRGQGGDSIGQRKFGTEN